MSKHEKKEKPAAEIAQQLHDVICANSSDWNEKTANLKPTGYFLILTDGEGSWATARKIDGRYVLHEVLQAMQP